MKKILLLFLALSSMTFAQFGDSKIIPNEKEFDFGDILEGLQHLHQKPLK